MKVVEVNLQASGWGANSDTSHNVMPTTHHHALQDEAHSLSVQNTQGCPLYCSEFVGSWIPWLDADFTPKPKMPLSERVEFQDRKIHV